MGLKEVATDEVLILFSVLGGLFWLAWLLWVGSSLSKIAESLTLQTERQKAQDLWVGSKLSAIAASLALWTERQKAQDELSAGRSSAAEAD